MAYGTAFSAWWRGRDGLRYRAAFDRRGWTGSDTHVRLFDFGLQRSVENSGVGAASCLASRMVSVVRVTVEDTSRGGFSAFAGAAPREWRFRLNVDLNADGDGETPEDYEVNLFTGYMIIEGIDERPFGDPPRVPLAFSDGFRFLQDHAVDAEYFGEYEPAVTHLLATLFPLGDGEEVGDVWTMPEGSWEGLNVATDWRPYRGGTEIASTVDPLAVVQVPLRAFVSGDGSADDQLTALGKLTSRFGARVSQSAGRLWVVQRDLVARAPDAVPVWGYHRDGTFDTTPTSTDLVRDCRLTNDWLYGGAGDMNPGRGVPVAVRAAQSSYDFEPDSYDLILNGSFEEAGTPEGATTGSDPRYWTLSSGTDHPERHNLTSDPQYGMDPGDGDVWALTTPGYHTSETERTAVQYGWVTFVPHPDTRLRFSYVATLEDDDSGRWGTAWTDVGRVSLLLDDEAGSGGVFFVKRADAVVTTTTMPGTGVNLYIEPLLDGVSGAVTGTVILPAGATVQIERPPDGPGEPDILGEFVLDAPLKVGDFGLSGDFSVTSTVANPLHAVAGDLVHIYYWHDSPATITPTDLNIRPVDTGEDVFLSGRAEMGVYHVDGRLVHGIPRTALYGPLLGSTGWSDEVRQHWDRVRWESLGPGGASSVLTYAARMPAGTAGAEVVVPPDNAEHQMGDGPIPSAVTKMRASATIGGAAVDTLRGNGELTNWKRGTHSGAPTQLFTIDDLLVDSALRQVGGVVEQWSGALFKEGEVIYPHEVLAVEQATTLMFPVVAAADTIYIWQRPEPGYPIRLSAKDTWADAEVLDFTDAVPFVAEGLGSGWTVTLDGTVGASYPKGARVAYALLITQESHTHDPFRSGGYLISGTRLLWDADTEYVREVRMGS